MQLSSELLPLLATILLPLSLLVAPAYSQNYLCYDQDGNFTSNETYGTTLDSLLGTIATTSSGTLQYGLFNVSASRPQYPDDIQVLGVCNGDVTAEECRDCLNRTSHQVRQLCPTKKQATLFEGECWIRYSGSQLYGVQKTSPVIIAYNTQNASDWDRFVVEVKKLLDSLRDQAASGGPIRKYATGTSSVDLYTLYGRVQCSPDLGDQQCNDCLVDIFPRMPQGKVGGEVLSPSCRYRYDTYRFFNSVAVPLPSPPPPPTVTRVPSSPPTRSGSDSSKKWIIVGSSSGSVVIVIICILVFLVAKSKKRPGDQSTFPAEVIDDDVIMEESPQFDLDIIRAATNNFSEDSKLGQGGFGSVFKGKLPNGKEIAVKRLSQDSGQGESEFKNEARLLSRLQHRNLVKLLGYCLEGIERLLVYEFVPNASLDKFIFDPLKRASLDWDSRYKIITGIARGLLYLHEDSRLRIIHRDLKASNILLDMDMHAKVSDFGTARLFELDQTRADTSRIMGTYGYMAPEYVARGHYSLKSDVFSFGVLVLEIVSGRRNLARAREDSEMLISCAWTSWREGNISNIVDPVVSTGYSINILRSIHIGLLCVQENESKRPTMASVVLMLNSQSVTLPVPTQPAFFMNTSSTDNVDASSGFDSTSSTVNGDRTGNNTGAFTINEASITDPYPR